jgi:hypothetical protein
LAQAWIFEPVPRARRINATWQRLPVTTATFDAACVFAPTLPAAGPRISTFALHAPSGAQPSSSKL